MCASSLNVAAAPDAETLDRRLCGHGSSVFMTVQPDGQCFLTFRFLTLPASEAASLTAALIRHRFATDERFRKDLFGWLLVEGRVHQRFAERHPGRVLLEEPRTAPLTSNR